LTDCAPWVSSGRILDAMNEAASCASFRSAVLCRRCRSVATPCRSDARSPGNSVKAAANRTVSVWWRASGAGPRAVRPWRGAASTPCRDVPRGQLPPDFRELSSHFGESSSQFEESPFTLGEPPPIAESHARTSENSRADVDVGDASSEHDARRAGSRRPCAEWPEANSVCCEPRSDPNDLTSTRCQASMERCELLADRRAPA
jgi:hypothetical protein